MAIQAESAELATVVEETVSGVRVVKGFGRSACRRRSSGPRPTTCTTRSMDATGCGPAYMPAMELLPNIGLIAVLGYGGHQVLDGELTLGELVAFNVYVALLIWPLRMLGQIVAQGQRAAAASRRVAEVLATDPQIVDHPPAATRCRPRARTATASARCASTRVTFCYSNRRARASSTASTSSSSRASRSRSSARPDAARRPSPA